MASFWANMTGGAELVNMDKVYVKPDAWGGAGAYARVPIKKGDLVEKGIVRVQAGVKGDACPYLLAWSDAGKDCQEWASGSGAAGFYNMSEDPNCHQTRDLPGQSFEIHATRNIAKDEELTEVYMSATWRTCFKDLKPMADKYIENQKKPQSEEKKEEQGEQAAASGGVFACCTSREGNKELVELENEVPGMVDMSKVVVKKDKYGGAGAFARVAIKKDETIEKGIVRVLPADGNICPFLFTWSTTEPRKWATGSGASVFYNMCEDPNSHMIRHFDKNEWEIVAARDIPAGEELTHVYISATWRTCFADLKPIAERYIAKEAELAKEAQAQSDKASADKS